MASSSLSITAAATEPELLDLPWHIALEDWPAEYLAALPRGISRHIVRFAHLGGSVIAIKETSEHVARHEYHMLRKLARLDVPCVEPVAVITGRTTPEGRPLNPVLVTRHLKFSMPYRALFSQMLRKDTLTRLIDAQALLLVRLHLIGFYWGDVSLSNTLFRRDAGAFAAYLVDAETGELYPDLSTGQREYDLEIARVNIAGELMDLLDGGLIEEKVDPVATSELIMDSYRRLWTELTEKESFEIGERWRVAARIRQLNELGFDVEEYAIKTTQNGSTIQLQPKVVDAGHHQRRLLRLTGLDAQENQARRLLNDMDSFRADNNPEHGRGIQRPPVGQPDLRTDCPVHPPRPVRASWSRRRPCTRSWSTAGTCPRRRTGTSRWPKPCSPTSTPSCATAATRRPSC